jgi:peptidoglycan/xylan/chitin deacetylase (PgdA/CDA1 family)
MRQINLIALLIALSAPFIALPANAAGNDSELLADASDPVVPISDGEIRLDGTVGLIHAAQGSFVLDVTSFTLPGGRSKMLQAPRPKLILVSRTTLLDIDNTGQSKPTLENLKPGSRVAAVGTDWGRGMELPAHRVTLLRSTSGTSDINVDGEAVVTQASGNITPAANVSPQVAATMLNRWALKDVAYYRSRAFRLAQDKVQFPYFSGGSSREKLVALTFDDGPDPRCTPQILDILKREKVPATFFVIGLKADKYFDLVLREAAEGHDIGNHTYHHFQVGNLDAQDWRFEIEQTNQIIARILGGPTRWFRAPGCHYTQRSLDILKDLNMVRVDTTANSGDSNGTSPTAIVKRSLTNLAPGAVILCHDRIPNTVTALPRLIHAIRQRGYRFVSLADLARRAQDTPGFQPRFWPSNQGITIEGVEPLDEDDTVLMREDSAN